MAGPSGGRKGVPGNDGFPVGFVKKLKTANEICANTQKIAD